MATRETHQQSSLRSKLVSVTAASCVALTGLGAAFGWEKSKNDRFFGEWIANGYPANDPALEIGEWMDGTAPTSQNILRASTHRCAAIDLWKVDKQIACRVKAELDRRQSRLHYQAIQEAAGYYVGPNNAPPIEKHSSHPTWWQKQADSRSIDQ